MSLSHCIILTSSYDTRRVQHAHLVKALCKVKNINCVIVDGAEAKNGSLRTTLFNIAQRNNGRQEYPAYFALHPDKSIVFLGHEREVQTLIDEDDVDPEILRQFPDVLTFTRCFKWPE